jgi:MFS family permease
LIGYSISSLTRPLVAVSTAGWHILIIRFFDRIGKGTRNSPRDALIADSCETSERGKVFGFQRAMDHFGAALGPIIAFLLLTFITSSYRIVFLVSFIPAIIAVLVIVFFVSEKKQDIEQKPQPLKISIKSFNKEFKFFLVIVTIFTLGNSSDAFLILRAKDVGVSTALIPILWVFLHIVKMLSSIPGGIISDKIGRKNVIIAGWIVYGLSYLGFGLANSQFHIWLLFAFYGLYFGLTEGVEKALVADLSKQENRGTAYGMYNLIVGISALPSSLLMGMLWHKFGYQTAFLTGAALSIIASICLFALSLKKT